MESSDVKKKKTVDKCGVKKKWYVWEIVDVCVLVILMNCCVMYDVWKLLRAPRTSCVRESNDGNKLNESIQ